MIKYTYAVHVIILLTNRYPPDNQIYIMQCMQLYYLPINMSLLCNSVDNAFHIYDMINTYLIVSTSGLLLIAILSKYPRVQ